MNVFSNPIADLSMTESVEIDFKQNCVKQGDVFFTTSSETPEEVGMSCVMSENIDNMYLNSFCFGYRPIEKFDLSYLAYALRSATFRKEIIKRGYYQIQKSVYIVSTSTKEKLNVIEKQLSMLVPSNSSVRTLTLTDDQFNKMKILSGELAFGEKILKKQNRILEY